MTTNSELFEGTTTLEERVPLATDEQLQVLIEFFDTEKLRGQFTELIALAKAEQKRRKAAK